MGRRSEIAEDGYMAGVERGIMHKMMGQAAARGAVKAAIRAGVDPKLISLKPYGISTIVYFSVDQTTPDEFYSYTNAGERSCWTTC